MFEVQDEIGRRVAESLHSRFPSAVPKSRDRYSSDPEAYDEFMAGLRESSSDRPGNAARAPIEHLSSAVERDPEFALAHAWLSYVSMNIHFSFDPQRTWLEQAEHHCRRALALDPVLPEGHLARAWILWSPAKNFQHAEAIAALEQVLAARPNFERAHNRMATICQHIGRLEEARIAHEQAQRSNPKTRSGNLEFIHLYSGDFARAEEAARPGFEKAPERICAPLPPAAAAVERRPGSGRATVGDGSETTARRALDRQPARHAARPAQSNRPGARVCPEGARFPRSFGHTHHTYYQIACVYAVLGETDKAMAWLERSVDTGFPAGRSSGSIHISKACARSPNSYGSSHDLEQTYTL